MGEIEEWFLSEYGRYGFSVGPQLIDINTFAPSKPIMLTRNGRMRKTHTHIIPEMANDLSGGFVPFDPTSEYKILIRQ